ncbi:MAG TPA: histidine kinase dimerization/phospho-acceptor domain-containing protein, partial [Candidatus Eisenbacteria bacterium]|nr:histidine kinase dimerization/phospho-acceptor domain-containing protein [Candidatus Eisenbacteria bacterium]
MTFAAAHAKNDTSNERIEVLHNKEIIVNTYLQALHNAKKWDYFAETKSLSLVPLAIQSLEEALIDAKNRGIKLRFITEITKDDISHCKDAMKIAELKHLDGVRGNFVVSDTEYIATNPTAVESDSITIPYAIYSNVKKDIKQQDYVFEILWNKAIPAEQKIREIEEGIVCYDTRIINNGQQIFKEIHRLIADSNVLYSSITTGGIECSYNHFFEAKKKLLERQKKGEHKGIKAITIIDESNKKLAKILVDAGIQIRHVKNLPPISFTLSDKEIAVTIEKREAGGLTQSLLLSNEPAYVCHFLSIFEELWKNGINAVDRIKDIEAGANLADIEVIQSSSRTGELYLELVKNAEEEILFIFPSSGAFIRQEKLGAVPLAIEAAKKRAAKVRILVPYNKEVEDRIKLMKAELGRRPIYNADIDVRYTEQTSGTMATILVVDRRVSLVMELRDDSTKTFDEAIGLSTYSNSKAWVLSYVAIFENLWVLTELYKHVKEANERPTLHDKMQQEFINVAAHELRTPIQPILTTVGLLHSKKGHVSNQQIDDSLEMIHRNAQRLKKLAEDILDVTKIETQSLILNKERLNLNDVVISAIKDVKNQTQDRWVGEAQILYESKGDDTIFAEADRYRVAQLVANLLSNALKFVKLYDGIVSISIEKKDNVAGGQEVALVSIKDNGTGIDPNIFPRLF